MFFNYSNTFLTISTGTNPDGLLARELETWLRSFKLSDSYFWKSNDLPRNLGEARGKIIVLKDFDGNMFGYPWDQVTSFDGYYVETSQSSEKSIAATWKGIEVHVNA